MTFESLLAVLGRFHPLILHLPIGVLVGMGALELWRLIQRDPAAKLAPPILGWFAAASGVAGIATGLLLAREPAYGGDSLLLHRNLGIGFGAMTVVAACLLQAASFSRTGAWRRAYGFSLVLALVLMMPAGHLGAGMTHGENFLFEPLDGAKPAVAVTPTGGTTPQAPEKPGQVGAIGEPPKAVMSILIARCVSCHSASKSKGGLALHDWDSIQRGGDLGPVINHESPERSEILVRMLLPLDDEDHMPPKTKGQPGQDEIDQIRAWLTGKPAAPQAAPPTPAPQNAPASAPPPIEPKAVDALRARLAHVQPVSQTDPLLWIDFSAVSGANDATVRELLQPLAGAIADLSLARTSITDATAEFLGSMPRLRRLDISSTAIGDAGLKAISRSTSIRELNAVGSGLTDGAIEALGAMKSLERVHLWNTAVTADGIGKLRAARSGLIASLDTLEPAKPVETEPQPVLGAKPASPSPTAPPASALTPINTTCPVSAAPVIAKYTIVHEGRVIGFCCPNCPREFWADPSKFADKLPPKP